MTTEESNFSVISTWKNPIFAEYEKNFEESATVPDMSIPLEQLIRNHTIDPTKFFYEDIGEDEITREEFLRMDKIEREQYIQRVENEVQRFKLGLTMQKQQSQAEEISSLEAAREAQEARERSEEQAEPSDG